MLFIVLLLGSFVLSSYLDISNTSHFIYPFENEDEEFELKILHKLFDEQTELSKFNILYL